MNYFFYYQYSAILWLFLSQTVLKINTQRGCHLFCAHDFLFKFDFVLLYQKNEDCRFRTITPNIMIFFSSWNSYKINQTQDKIGVFVSIVSTKIPFKGTGKEYIGDDISEIASAVKVLKCTKMTSCQCVFISGWLKSYLQTAIQQCCVQLKSKIVKRIQAREQQERKRSLSK